MLNPDGRLWIDRLGAGIADTGSGMSAADGERIIRLVAHHVGAEVHAKAPRVSAELPDTGERFEGLLPPVVAAPSFAIRKPAVAVFTLADYVAAEIMSAWQAEALVAAVAERDLLTLFNYFLRFLWDGGIEEYEDEAEYAPSGCVSFMTIHQSKGLEFPIVIAGSLDAVPRRQQSPLDDLLEAEFGDGEPFEPLDRIKTFDFWRLFYTAFSRAQNMLVLSCQENTPKARGQRNVPTQYFQPIYSPLKGWRALQFDPGAVKLATIKEASRDALQQRNTGREVASLGEQTPQFGRRFDGDAFAVVQACPASDGVKPGRHRGSRVPHRITRDRYGQRCECGGDDDANQDEAAPGHGNNALRWSQARWRARL